MRIELTFPRLAALSQARRSPLMRRGRGWARRGVGTDYFDRRTIDPLVKAGLLGLVDGGLGLTDAGRSRLTELEGRR